MNIIFTLITGSVGGALSGAIIQYFLKGCEIKKEKQRKVFENYLEQLQRYINSGNQGLENFQKATTQLLLYADENTAKIVNEYYSKCTKKLNKKIEQSSLTSEEHENYHDKIIKAMRKNLRLKSNNIGICSLHRTYKENN